MSRFDLMSLLQGASSWMSRTFSGEATGATKGGTQVSAGGSPRRRRRRTGQLDPGGVLGGMVGGFGGAMDWKGAGFGGVGNLDVSEGRRQRRWPSRRRPGRRLRHVGPRTGKRCLGRRWRVAPAGVYGSSGATKASADTSFYSALGASADWWGQGRGSRRRGQGHLRSPRRRRHQTPPRHGVRLGLGRTPTTSTARRPPSAASSASTATVLRRRERLAAHGRRRSRGRDRDDYGKADVEVGSFSDGTNLTGGASYDAKTGAADIHGGGSTGLYGKDIGFGVESADGKSSYPGDVGRVKYGYEGDARSAGIRQARGHARRRRARRRRPVDNAEQGRQDRRRRPLPQQAGRILERRHRQGRPRRLRRRPVEDLGRTLDATGSASTTPDASLDLGEGKNAVHAGASFDNVAAPTRSRTPISRPSTAASTSCP